jgi:hypothetical protein
MKIEIDNSFLISQVKKQARNVRYVFTAKTSAENSDEDLNNYIDEYFGLLIEMGYSAMEEKLKEESRKLIDATIPSWAKSAVVAIKHENTSVLAEDYLSCKTVDAMILGYSNLDRQSFEELKRFAATREETKSLEFNYRMDYKPRLVSNHYEGWQVRRLTIAELKKWYELPFVFKNWNPDAIAQRTEQVCAMYPHRELA